MKKNLFYLVVVCLLFTACSKKTDTVKNEAKEVEFANVDVTSIESVNAKSEEQNIFNVTADFKYTGDDNYVRVITEELNKVGKEKFTEGVILIPTPYIVKIDMTNADDIKVYGDFWIYGYQVSGTIFKLKSGESMKGCFHLKDTNGELTFVSKEIVDEGMFLENDLLDLCGGDQKLVDSIMNIDTAVMDEMRLGFIDMYANENNIRFSGLKDDGWPIVLKKNISDAAFLYNFYAEYFNEVAYTDSVDALQEKLYGIKILYMTDELIDKIDSMSEENNMDMMIKAQDVTLAMIDSLQVDNLGSGKLKVSYDVGSGTRTIINVMLGTRDGNKVLTDIYYD